MQLLLLLTIAFAMGAITPIYLPMNSSVARYVGSPVLANVSFFFIALATTLIALSLTLLWPSNVSGVAIITKYKDVPVYLYLSGILSAFLILGTTALIPRLGASTFFILFVSGQIIMAAIVSHFGILESPQEPISTQKVVGIALLIIGVTLTTFKQLNWLPTLFKSFHVNF